MARKLSIGIRWALRYTVAMSVTLTVFALVVHTQVKQRINREARLVTEIQARNLVEGLRTQTEEHPRTEVLEWFSARAKRAVRNSDADLGLGVEYLDESGKPLISVGSLSGESVPVPWDLLRGERDSGFRAVNLGGEYAYFLTVLPAPHGFVQVAIDTRRYAENVTHVRDVLVVSFPIMLILTGGLGWLLARGSLGSIAEITGSARRISGSNLRETIPTTGSGDELDQLAQTLNAMMQRIQESVERMHRFNSNAAHELRTPLAGICNQIEVTLEMVRNEGEYRRVLEDVLGQARHLARGVDAMLRLSRSEAGIAPEHIQLVSIAPLIETVVEFFDPVAGDQGVVIRPVSIPDVRVNGDGSWLHQIFANLIDNAIKYCSAGDEVRVAGELRDGWLLVRVSDSGPGISPQDLRHIFDRFQRGDRHRIRSGFGLGLPLAQEIARAHGGRIEADSTLQKGSTFTVWLPIAAAEPWA